MRLLVRRAGVWRVVPLDRIDWIEADGNYVRIHAGGEVLTCRRTLGGMAARLDPERFVRIHRGAIVHIDRIAELVPTPSGTYVVHLRDGTRLTLSRGQRARVLALVGRV